MSTTISSEGVCVRASWRRLGPAASHAASSVQPASPLREAQLRAAAGHPAVRTCVGLASWDQQRHAQHYQRGPQHQSEHHGHDQGTTRSNTIAISSSTVTTTAEFSSTTRHSTSSASTDLQQQQCIQQRQREYFFVGGHARLLRGFLSVDRQPVLPRRGKPGHPNFCSMFWTREGLRRSQLCSGGVFVRFPHRSHLRAPALVF